MMKLQRLLALVLAIALLIPLAPSPAIEAQEEDPVVQIMAQMSDAAKVGQLFLVTFPGSTVTEESAITELIREYHIGGVALLPENGNIDNAGNTPRQVATLVHQLQQAAWAATQPITDPVTLGLAGEGEERTPPGPFIPLLIAVSHEGNGMPYTSIVSGTTPLPSQMALGATWRPAYAESVGQIVGQELSAMGINMLFGPLLDVLETPRPESTGDLGVRAFGGEPFWVGQMGKAYIHGVHTGGEGQVAVIAKHFPGLGSSDRSLNEEISTVQRTLDKLRQVDLLPFATVVQAEEPMERPDGVIVSHIRFRGLEGGRFTTTGPISVDSQVLQRLLGLPELMMWREQGGVTISDGLGLRALRRFYDPNEESFNSRRIAQDAFLAGNDLLYLSQFALSDDWENQIANIKSTITFFQEKYTTDSSFQTLVDAAVARILRLKLRLYGGTFDLEMVQPDVENVDEQVGTHGETLSAIAREAVTLLSPPSPDLVPPPPTYRNSIVIFTDNREGQPCATCEPVPYIDPTALRNTILRLYGPDATGQINPLLVNSFTYAELETYMSTTPPSSAAPPTTEETRTPTPTHPIETALSDADWIIFAMLNPTTGPSQSTVVRRFLAERADALLNPHLVVLAYDAPYYLDATEISKLSAYYGAYSRIDPFIEALVRALFSEFAPVGTSPVSVPGINYNLLLQTAPDPEQNLTLYYEISTDVQEGEPTPEATVAGEATPEATAEGQPTPTPPQPVVGDELKLRTGVIVDHNGHPVPDGTPVQFIFAYPREGLGNTIVATTQNGVAETTLTLDRTGQLDISLQADPVPRTLVLQITIPEGEPAIILTPTPLPSPTPTPTPTSTPAPAPVIEDTPTPTLQPIQPEEEPTKPWQPGILDLILAMTSVLFVGGAGYSTVRMKNGSVSRALRLALWCIVGGLTLYLAYALHLPGVNQLREWSGVWAAVWVALSGSAAGWVLVWLTEQGEQPT